MLYGCLCLPVCRVDVGWALDVEKTKPQISHYTYIRTDPLEVMGVYTSSYCSNEQSSSTLLCSRDSSNGQKIKPSVQVPLLVSVIGNSVSFLPSPFKNLTSHCGTNDSVLK